MALDGASVRRTRSDDAAVDLHLNMESYLQDERLETHAWHMASI